jgi:[ribosomal protein S18]-alanine N-acetyltransferase
MEETLLVRPARVSELTQLAVLDAELFGSEPYPAFFFRQAHDVFGDLLQVAELRPTGELAGYALAALAACSDVGWILSVGVRAELRGHGIAAALTRSVMEYLTLRGAAEVRLTVAPGNEPALRLYRATGFEPIEQHEEYFGDAGARVVLAWRAPA